MKNNKIHVGRYWVDLYNVVGISDLTQNKSIYSYVIYLSSGAELVINAENGVTYDEFVKLWLDTV